MRSTSRESVVRHHPNYRHEREAINWARAVLDQPERYVILDTETTGLAEDDEVIQIGVVAPSGEVLLDHLIRPTRKRYIHPKALQVHGISMQVLQDKPLYGQISHLLETVVRGRKVITYNAEFDRRLLQQTAGRSGAFVPPDPWDCAMLQYAQFIGEWDDYRNKYRWHKLRDGDHTAVGDCRATLARIQEMAGAKRRKYVYEVLATADEVVEGSEAPPPPSRESRCEPRSVQGFGISISLDEGVQIFGMKEPSSAEQDAELNSEYLKALRAYEANRAVTVTTMTEIVRFVAASYRDMTPEQLDGATHHSGQVRVVGIPYIVGRAIKCYREIKKMESATTPQLLRVAGNLETYVDHITYGLPHGNQDIRAEAKAIQEIVQESVKTEFFFRIQVIWSDMWDEARQKILALEKKAERKKRMNEFIKKIKDLCDARVFRGLKEERERFIDYVKAQCEPG